MTQQDQPFDMPNPLRTNQLAQSSSASFDQIGQGTENHVQVYPDVDVDVDGNTPNDGFDDQNPLENLNQ